MDIIVGENDELFVRPLIWKVFPDDLDEDRDDFQINEIRCCNCFIDQIMNLIGEKKIVTFDFIYNNVTHPENLTWVSAGDIFLFYSSDCVFYCEKYKSNFEMISGLNKHEMDESCIAYLDDYHCVYYLSRETLFPSMCDGCRRELLKNISGKLIKIKI